MFAGGTAACSEAEAEDCSLGVCNCSCADSRDNWEPGSSADTSHEMPGMSAECRTAGREANFTEAEHSVITNNTRLATHVCFRT